MSNRTNDHAAAFDNFVFQIWEAAKDGVDPETETDGPANPVKAISALLMRERGAFSAFDQYDALASAEAWGRQTVEALEQDLARARRALTALQSGPADLMRSQITEVD